MRLLILTQKVDKDDPVLGFFHRWLEEFAKRFESIIVICLERGVSKLPSNVKILSLGKESGRSKVEYLLRFYKYIWQERNNYDSVLVHMNQEYVLLGWKLWKLLGKKVYLWRNHYAGSLLTDIASLFCHKIFCTSKYSYTAKYKKTRFMPVGIDTEVFKPNLALHRNPRSILSLGRISPSKKIDLLIETLGRLKEMEADFSVDIYGDALVKDKSYAESLRQQVRHLKLEKHVHFHNGVSYDKIPEIYQTHQIFVNVSPVGMYDKTILEAAACGCLVLAVSTDALADIEGIVRLPIDDVAEIVKIVGDNLINTLDESSKKRQYEEVVTKHSLKTLVNSLSNEID